jgi:acyl-coenzyme A thioesterase PaaI-like protein
MSDNPVSTKVSVRQASVRKGKTLSELWSTLNRYPMGKALFSFLVGRTARYSGTINATVLELGGGRGVLQMKDRAMVRNHLKSVHAIALMNLGELTTGLTVMHEVDGRGRGIVTELSMEYVKKARGTITARCEASVPLSQGDHEFVAVGVLEDTSGEVVARCSAHWKLQIFGDGV